MKLLAFSLLLLLASAALGLQVGRRLAEHDESSPEWTYRRTGAPGEEPYGPDDWHLGYPDCAGAMQSPINLADDVVETAERGDFQLHFTRSSCDSSELVFQADYTVWEVHFDGCTTTPHLYFRGEKYNLLQIHIHSPSEFTFGGAEDAAGMHLVHVKNGTTDDLLVVGVQFDVNEYGTNTELEKYWEVLDDGEATTTENFTTAAYDILPSNPSFTTFMGSLTTPPCTEGVRWIVMNEAVFMGKGQLDEYRESVAKYPGSKVSEQGNTNRPVQPSNGRNVSYVVVEG